jgi:hypothetical protein
MSSRLFGKHKLELNLMLSRLTAAKSHSVFICVHRHVTRISNWCMVSLLYYWSSPNIVTPPYDVLIVNLFTSTPTWLLLFSHQAIQYGIGVVMAPLLDLYLRSSSISKEYRIQDERSCTTFTHGPKPNCWLLGVQRSTCPDTNQETDSTMSRLHTLTFPSSLSASIVSLRKINICIDEKQESIMVKQVEDLWKLHREFNIFTYIIKT